MNSARVISQCSIKTFFISAMERVIPALVPSADHRHRDSSASMHSVWSTRTCIPSSWSVSRASIKLENVFSPPSLNSLCFAGNTHLALMFFRFNCFTASRTSALLFCSSGEKSWSKYICVPICKTRFWSQACCRMVSFTEKSQNLTTSERGADRVLGLSGEGSVCSLYSNLSLYCMSLHRAVRSISLCKKYRRARLWCLVESSLSPIRSSISVVLFSSFVISSLRFLTDASSLVRACCVSTCPSLLSFLIFSYLL